jgi:hypothetical protein
MVIVTISILLLWPFKEHASTYLLVMPEGQMLPNLLICFISALAAAILISYLFL